MPHLLSLPHNDSCARFPPLLSLLFSPALCSICDSAESACYITRPAAARIPSLQNGGVGCGQRVLRAALARQLKLFVHDPRSARARELAALLDVAEVARLAARRWRRESKVWPRTVSD